MLFGAHESIEGGIFNAILRGQTATCDTIQMFNKSNNQWRAKKLEKKEVDKFFQTIEETNVTVTCSHSSYLINLASPDPALNEKSYLGFKEEVERCNLLKIPNLVFHPGAHVGSGEEAGIQRISDNLNKLFSEVADNTVCVCLEVTAGQGSTLGYKFEQIAAMIEKVENSEQLGVCIDTCHIFAAGYGLSDKDEYDKTIKAFDKIVGLKRLKVLHLNDSKKEFGSRVDRHEQIGKGKIGLEAFRHIVNDPRLKKVPRIIETDKTEPELLEDIENLKVLRGLVGK